MGYHSKWDLNYLKIKLKDLKIIIVLFAILYGFTFLLVALNLDYFSAYFLVHLGLLWAPIIYILISILPLFIVSLCLFVVQYTISIFLRSDLKKEIFSRKISKYFKIMGDAISNSDSNSSYFSMKRIYKFFWNRKFSILIFNFLLISILTKDYRLMPVAILFFQIIVLPCSLILYYYFLFIQMRQKHYNFLFGFLFITFCSFIVFANIFTFINTLTEKNSLKLIYLEIMMAFFITSIITSFFPMLKPKRNFGKRKATILVRILDKLSYKVFILLFIFIYIIIVIDSNRSFKIAFSLGFCLLILLIFKLAIEIGFGIRMERYRDTSHSDIEKVIESDKRAGVLYLRPFYQESNTFFLGPMDEIKKYATYTKTLYPEFMKRIEGVTFEQYFYREIDNNIGPFLALGSPEDFIQPEGASRKYADDENWQDNFKEISRQAAFILTEVSKSDNLKWELDWIKKSSLQEKLFVITRPKGIVYEDIEIDFLFHIFGVLIRTIKGTEISWKSYANELHKLDYFLSYTNPGNGAVITFDNDGKSKILTTNARKPSEYIMAIQKWRLERKILGSFNYQNCGVCDEEFIADSSNEIEEQPVCSSCIKKRNEKEAIETYNKAIEKNPKCIEALYNKGLFLENLGMDYDAIEMYEKIIEIDRNFIDAWNQKGNLLLKIGNYREAVETYDGSIEIDPTNSTILNNKQFALTKINEK